MNVNNNNNTTTTSSASNNDALNNDEITLVPSVFSFAQQREIRDYASALVLQLQLDGEASVEELVGLEEEARKIPYVTHIHTRQHQHPQHPTPPLSTHNTLTTPTLGPHTA